MACLIDYFIHTSHQCVYLFAYPFFVARKRLSRALTLQLIRKKQKKNCCTRCFYMRSVSYEIRVANLSFLQIVEVRNLAGTTWNGALAIN
jgi:hypothetical protein